MGSMARVYIVRRLLVGAWIRKDLHFAKVVPRGEDCRIVTATRGIDVILMATLWPQAFHVGAEHACPRFPCRVLDVISVWGRAFCRGNLVDEQGVITAVCNNLPTVLAPIKVCDTA